MESLPFRENKLLTPVVIVTPNGTWKVYTDLEVFQHRTRIYKNIRDLGTVKYITLIFSKWNRGAFIYV